MKSQNVKPTKANLKVYVFRKEPEVDLAPQAQIILKAIQKHGSITRISLLSQIAPVLETNMTASRVLSFHSTGLVRCGCIEIKSLEEYEKEIESRTKQ